MNWGFWFAHSLMSNQRRISADLDNYENERKIRDLEQKMKKIEQDKPKVVVPPQPDRCYHSYHENLSGHWDLKRYGCVCPNRQK